MKTLLYIFLMLAIVLPSSVMAAGPMDTLKPPIEKVIKILKDPQLKDSGQKKIQREKIWDIISRIFDYTFISKSTLGRYHWQNSLTIDQKKEFSDVFSRFLGNTYLDKIQEGFENEQIVFAEEELLTPHKAMVKTKIIRKNMEIPVNYRMKTNDGEWKIYDVNIEGISLVQNYRSQFQSILLNQTAAQLIEQLKSKLKEQEPN